MESIFVILSHIWDIVNLHPEAMLAGPLAAIPAALGAGGAVGGLGGALGLSGLAGGAVNAGAETLGGALSSPGGSAPQTATFRPIQFQPVLNGESPIQQQSFFQSAPLQIQRQASNPLGDLTNLLGTLQNLSAPQQSSGINDTVFRNSISKALSPGTISTGPASMPGLFGDVGASLKSGTRFL